RYAHGPGADGRDAEGPPRAREGDFRGASPPADEHGEAPADERALQALPGQARSAGDGAGEGPGGREGEGRPGADAEEGVRRLPGEVERGVRSRSPAVRPHGLQSHYRWLT